jgi:hypothetical protein
MSNFNPGAVVTVGTLEVGDTVFLYQRRNYEGLPVPHTPAVVTELVPLADGRVRVYVINPGAGAGVPARLLGDLPSTREFRAAVAA